MESYSRERIQRMIDDAVLAKIRPYEVEQEADRIIQKCFATIADGRTFVFCLPSLYRYSKQFHTLVLQKILHVFPEADCKLVCPHTYHEYQYSIDLLPDIRPDASS
jgi:hypothetical protein